MKPIKSLINADEAFELMMNSIKVIEDKEKVRISEAHKRILAKNIKAPFDVPSFRRSAMDGYAVKAEDTFGAGVHSPKTFKVIGEIFAGDSKNIKVKERECVKIATGAMVPDSCDAVVMVENTEEKEDMVLIYKPVYPMENISKIGEDIKKGEIVLKKGMLIDPSKLGALAAMGFKDVTVIRKPVVGIISTGNEVVPLGGELIQGKIYDINTYTLKAIVESNFCNAVTYGIVRDEKESLKKIIDTAMENDLIVFSGGSSVGERDMMLDILGKSILFHGVRVRPGKPMIFAVYQGKNIIGLPGYPASCLTNAYVFLAPMLRKLAGAPKRERQIIKAKMAHRVHSVLGRREFLTVRIENGYAYSVYKESSAITSLAKAIGFIIIDENTDLVERDEEVDVELFSW